MVRYAITGVSGVLGQLLLAHLTALPEVEHVAGIDLRPPAAFPKKLHFHRLDVRAPALRDLIKAEDIDTVIHLAFVLNPIHDERLTRDVDLNGTRNVLAAALAGGVRHILVTSSVAAYGAWPDNPVPLIEEHSLRPNPDFQYSVDKAEVDRMCQHFAAEHPDVAMAILRPTFVLGPHIQNYFTRYLRRLPWLPVVRGNDGPMQFAHEDDLVGICIAILRRRASGIFNLGGAGTLRWSQVIRRAGKRPLFLPLPLLYRFADAVWQLRLPLAGAPAGQLHFTRFPYVVSCAKAKRELGFQPRYSTVEALEAFCEQGREEPGVDETGQRRAIDGERPAQRGSGSQPGS